MVHMCAVNIKKPEKVFLFCHIIIEFSINFNGAISGGGGEFRSRTVNIIFGSHHVTRTTSSFILTSRIGSFPEARIYLI